MIRIKSVVLQASKVIDFQFHLLIISSPGQSPLTPPFQYCPSMKTSSMLFAERNLSIKNFIKKKKINMKMSEISLSKLLLLRYYFNFFFILLLLLLLLLLLFYTR